MLDGFINQLIAEGGTTLYVSYVSKLSLPVCLSISLSLYLLSPVRNVCCQDLSRDANRSLDTIVWIRFGEPDFVETGFA